MTKTTWQTDGRQHLWMPYTQMKTANPPLAIDRTDGCYLITADGRRLLDGISSWWIACHGYNHPYIVDAVKQQLEKMPHVMMGGIQHEPAATLATRLADLLPSDLDRVFFSDSGSVGVEVALKMAVQYWLNQGQQGKNRFVNFVDSYHGDTVGAMSVCDPEDSMHSHFKGYLLEQYPQPIPKDEAKFADFEQFLSDHKAHLAGVIIEPLLQAAGGMRMHSPRQLKQIADACQRQDLLLIVDEIATGFGRTGSMFAIDQAEIVPDIICLGKGLTGGVQGLAATVAREEIYQAFHADEGEKALMHGPTFMGNALACAAANASLDLFEQEPRLEQVQQINQLMSQHLQTIQDHENVLEVRSLGAVAAIHCKVPPNKNASMKLAIERGVWLRPLRDVVYIMPPFVIDSQQTKLLCQVAMEIIETTS